MIGCAALRSWTPDPAAHHPRTRRAVHRRRLLRRHRPGRGPVTDAGQHRALHPVRPHRLAQPQPRPDRASPATILTVDLYGAAVVLEEFGNVVAPGGSEAVI